jgi:hypothetical protein
MSLCVVFEAEGSRHGHTMAAHDIMDACLEQMKFKDAKPEAKTRLILHVVEMVQEHQYRLVKNGLKTLLDEIMYEMYRDMIRIAYGTIKSVNKG